jgi:NAD(P)-dependent dehydrogenase (short-subunit alcohol dehydrogenase family)
MWCPRTHPWQKQIILEDFGNLTVVHPSGVLHLGPTEIMPDDQWDNTIAVMLTAPFQLTKRCLPAMKKKGNSTSLMLQLRFKGIRPDIFLLCGDITQFDSKHIASANSLLGK